MRTCVTAAEIFLLAIFAGFVAFAESSASGGTGALADQTIRANGKDRQYRLFIPESLDPKKPAPLVFAYHGLGGDGEGMARLTQLDVLAAKEGFIAVYPNGDGGNWPLRVLRSRDELAFFDALLKTVCQSHNVDASRVYLTGISNGAYFVNLLAAQRSDKIAAIAPHSGGLGALAIRGINAKRKYPVMVIHGTADKIVPVSQGRKTRDAYKKEGHEVEYVEVDGLGHMWAHSANINEKIWRFLQEHPLNK